MEDRVMTFEIKEDYIRRAIAGDSKALVYAFVWGDTPQGHGFWSDQYHGRTPIDVAALKAMLGEDDRQAVLERAVADAIEALEFYTQSENWRLNGPLDGNSGNYTGGPARDALVRLKKIAEGKAHD
jgi:hypothetical protein